MKLKVNMPTLDGWYWIDVKDHGYRLEMTLELCNPNTQEKIMSFFVFKEVYDHHTSYKFLNSYHYNVLKNEVSNHARKLGYRWKDA